MKHYTFDVVCSFSMQFTFTDQQVQQDADGNEGDFEPTDAALVLLAAELKEYLQQTYPADKVDIFTDSDSMLGVDIDSTGRSKKSS